MSSKRQEQVKLIDKLSKKKDKGGKCLFEKAEIEKLVSMFNKYVEGSGNGKLDRIKFRDILHDMFGMTDDMLMDRVFRAFDRDNDNYVNHDEWVLGLAIFTKGKIEETTKYCFTVYDLNGDGYISREEMFQLLKSSLVKVCIVVLGNSGDPDESARDVQDLHFLKQPTEEDPDEAVKELVEMSLKKLDVDHDSRVSYTDFENSVKDDPLLLEALGPCLPTPDKKECFLSLIGNEGTKY